MWQRSQLLLTNDDRHDDEARTRRLGLRELSREAILSGHPGVADCTVVGVPSEDWGETPVGFYVAREGASAEPDDILGWFNANVGKTQRLAALERLDELPRNAIGKVLKRELRDRWIAGR